MSIRILFFGATASITGTREIELPFSEDIAAASALFDKVTSSYPELLKHKLLMSINQQYAVDDQMVHDGDEVAVFTAVSGG